MSSSCIFCKIAKNEDEKTKLIYEDDSFVVFKDISPASKHHYLVIPRLHVKDPKQLKKKDAQLVENLYTIGKQVLQDQGEGLQDARFGFHWPPFCLISHLHLHVIAPTKDMGFIKRIMFRPNSYWFISVEDLLQRLNKMPDDQQHNTEGNPDEDNQT